MNKLLALTFILSITIDVLAGLTISKLVKGEKANDKEFPWQVAIYHRGSLKCGGTILSEIHIITAGHCLMENNNQINPSELTVVAGLNDISDWFSAGYDVSNIRIHNEMVSNGSYENDIAVLSLDKNIKFDDAKKPAKLPEKDTEEGATVWLSGWGKTKDSEGWADLPHDLMKMETVVVDNASCQKKLGRNIIDRHICTYISGGHGACTGDSGSGLVDGETLVGIASWVYKDCASKGFPDVYIRVYSYLPWIKEILQSNN